MSKIEHIYVDLCDSLKDFFYLQKLTESKIKNKYFKLILFKLLIKFKLIIKMKYGKDSIYIIFSKNSDDLENRVEKKLKSIGKEDNLVLSEKLISTIEKSNKFYINKYLLSKKKNKSIYRKEIGNVIEKVMSIKQENTNENNLFVLLKEIDDFLRPGLVQAAYTYKSLNIVTNNIRNFARLEEEIYNTLEIPIVVTNNKKKALLNARYILNVDYSQEDIAECNINRNATIFNISNNNICKIKGFCGTIINNIVVKDVSSKNYIERRFEYIIKPKVVKYEIVKFIGNNGDISQKELKKTHIDKL